ncbi:MAG: hypothetical protein JWO39_832 [Gemmatimonadetes bacterium]|jgi:hypothetical protein|nr:hypothetical protein [Gemmatimonadota bacterium]
MGAIYDTPAIVHDAVDDALRLIRKRGFRIEASAEEELKELVNQGFRELAATRVLDLPGPEQTRALNRARVSLNEFLDAWMRAESRGEEKVLTTAGLHSAQSELCPIFPFE